MSTGTTPSTKRADYYIGDVPFIKTSEIVNNKISRATAFVSRTAVADYNLRVYQRGTVLIAMYGQGRTRGQVALLDIAAATTQNAAALEPDENLDSRFLWQYLLSSYERLRSMGSLGHLSHLNLGYLREFLMVRPPISEQRDIAAIFEAIDQKIDRHERRRVALRELFDTLLHKLMTGEIRIGDLEIDTTDIAA
jgi:restriction endonuclease S subunit